MPVEIKNLVRGGGRIYSYSSAADSLAVIASAGYFSDPRVGFTGGELIGIDGADGSAVFIADGPGSATINQDTSSGWGAYGDTQYTVGSPFALAANTDTALPNNGLNAIESQKPIDIVTFYDGTVITGRDGDGISITFEFKAVPGSTTNTYVEIWIDIGGTVGELYRRTLSFSKGAGTYSLNASFTGYTLGTWEANGGTVYVRSNTTVDMYAIRYILTRTHKAR